MVSAQTWVQVSSVPNPGSEPSISVVNSDVAWIAGGTANNPIIFRTLDGGHTWLPVSTQGTVNQLRCISAINQTTAFVGEGFINSYSRIYKTNDLTQWSVILQTGQNDGTFNNLIFSKSNPNIGCALADEMFITTNGGNTWVQRSTGVTGVSSAQNSLMFLDESFFGFGLKNGAARVRMSLNGGSTWFTKNVNIPGSYTSGFTFKSDKLTGLSSTSESMPLISRTTDGGITWTPINIGSGLTGKTFAKWVPYTSVVYIIGENGAIKRSTNDGITWTSMQTANVTNLNHFDFNKVNNIICGYAISTNGSVIKLIDSVLVHLTNTEPVNSNVPSEYKLHQNYPNPFNPVTNVAYDIPSNSFVNLRVYDMLGKEVGVLVNENKTAGKYTVTFNADNHTSGIYFCKLNVISKDFEKTFVSKMTLLK
ncbi:MAG: T9SS type A sorting domain-containing protein [Ignavibacteria bacterium]|nr:T9SS type A sorting domain-containing protein [Ignavibacteria bacterium]